MVVHQLDGEVAFGQELDVVVELAGRDGASSGLLDLGRATGLEALVEVGRSDGELVVRGLEEEVGENRDGGLPLDDRLCGGQFAQQFGA